MSDGTITPQRDEAAILFAENNGNSRFSMTGLGLLPRDWEVRALGDISTVVTGRTPPAAVPDAWGDSLPFVTPGDIPQHGEVGTIDRWVSERGRRYVKELPPDAVLVVCIGSIGKVGLSTFPTSTNQQINAVLAKDGYSPSYLCGAISKFVRQLWVMAGLQVLPIINKSSFETFLVPCPPLPEQQAIARILDIADEAIEKTERLIEHLQQAETGMLHDLLTRGIDEHGQLRDPEVNPEQFHETELGLLPRDWGVTPLGALLADHFPGEWGEEPTRDASAWVLRATNMNAHGNLDYETAAPRVIASGKIAAKAMRHGDIVLEASGGSPGKPVGRAAMFEDQADGRRYLVSNFFRTLRPMGKAVHDRYLALVLAWSYKLPRIWTYQQQTTGITNLNYRLFIDQRLPLPSLDEQRRVATALLGLELRLRAERQGLAELRTLKAGLMDDLLTGRVRVPEAVTA